MTNARRDRFAPVICAALCAVAVAQEGNARTSAVALYRPPLIRNLVINPSGDLFAFISNRGGSDRLVVRDREGDRIVTAMKQLWIRRVEWIDDRHLLVARGFMRREDHRIVVVSTQGDTLTTEAVSIAANGRLAHLLPQHASDVLWAMRRRGRSVAFRVPISKLLGEDGDSVATSGSYPEVASLEGGRVHAWVVDRAGQVRAALRRPRKGLSELWIRDAPGADWRSLLTKKDAKEFPHPVGFAENDRDLLVLSGGEEETTALFVMDATDGRLGREVFAHPEADVTGVVMGYGGEVIGVVYEQAGLDHFRHLDAFFDRYQRSLERVFPGRSVSVTSTSRDHRRLVVVTQDPRDPGTFYVLDSDLNTARELGRSMPWLDREDLYDVEVLRVDSANAEIEAFLSRPRPQADGSPSPMVALPHGGPRGVRDKRTFDPLVQFLSDRGIAVLQVNYRGSAGRGRRFLRAGDREWGQGIEDDIDAAVDAAGALPRIDAARVCIAGGSYGGYSALISVIRSPERYRCAASLNGPTDVPFAYYSHFRWWREGEEYFEEHIGDVEGDYEGMKEISPLYRAEEIRVPVFLAHGDEDPIVDVGHFHRMTSVLELLGKPHEAYLIKGGSHSPTGPEWVEFARRLERFLNRHLEIRLGAALGSRPSKGASP